LRDPTPGDKRGGVVFPVVEEILFLVELEETSNCFMENKKDHE